MEKEKEPFFTAKEFSVFSIEGLEERMKEIKTYIQPKFSYLGKLISESLESELDGAVLPVHVAKHLRRTKFAPENTWVGIGGDARGYKKYPHFQIAINKNAVYIWLAFIDNPQFEKEMAACFLKDTASIKQLSEEYIISLDHTKDQVTPIKEVDIAAALTRWQKVKKGEFMIGRCLKKEDSILNDAEQTEQFILNTVCELIPIYKQAYAAYPKEMVQ
ncbi:DUF1054 family protein [Desemzia sp. RIT804]|uniref:DUF1054 family protein n=1 Tax=Desemzia sp. RIT 804 TaxID=2810209 RepID=UPI00195257A4|nr:DUF1054 family protein [Desemzia sp. RIT 804]MBM6613526.1 DUF1054 family protein [Desemzia sp. RIT 804]